MSVKPDSGPRQTTLLLAAVLAVFAVISLVRFPVPGVNEPHYLTKARSSVDDTWCSNDFFLQSANAHAVFFALVGPLTKVFSFAAVALSGRLFSLSLIAWGWILICRRLGLRFSATVCSSAIFCAIALLGNLSGEWIVGGFESKVPAYGFALIGMAWWIDSFATPDGRRLKNAVGCGLMFGFSVAFHPVVGGWICVGIASADLLLQWIRQSARTADIVGSGHERSVRMGFRFVATGFWLLGSFPGLLPAVKLVKTAQLPETKAQAGDFVQVFGRLAHHLDPSTFTLPAWCHTAVLMTVVLGIARRSEFVRASQSWRAFLYVLLISGVIAAAGVMIGWHFGPPQEMSHWPWRAFFLKFYPFRLFDAMLPITASMLLATAIQRRCLVQASSKQRFLAMSGLAGTAICIAVLFRQTAPPGYSPLQFTAWKEVCAWISLHTPEDVLVCTPRESFAFKWYAQRAEYVCYKDCPQDRSGILEWRRRLGNMEEWTEANKTDGRFSNDDLKRLRELTGSTHVLTRRLGPFEAAPVYANDIWRIYETQQISP